MPIGFEIFRAECLVSMNRCHECKREFEGVVSYQMKKPTGKLYIFCQWRCEQDWYIRNRNIFEM